MHPVGKPLAARGNSVLPGRHARPLMRYGGVEEGSASGPPAADSSFTCWGPLAD